MLYSQNASYRRACKSSEREKGEGIDFSGSLAQSFWQTIEHLNPEQLDASLIP